MSYRVRSRKAAIGFVGRNHTHAKTPAVTDEEAIAFASRLPLAERLAIQRDAEKMASTDFKALWAQGEDE